MSSEPEANERTEMLMQIVVQVTKMVLIANAGGVLATLGVAKVGNLGGSIAWPLGFFCLGVMLSMSYAVLNGLGVAEKLGAETGLPAVSGKNNWFLISGLGALGCFAVGSIAGVIIVAYF